MGAIHSHEAGVGAANEGAGDEGSIAVLVGMPVLLYLGIRPRKGQPAT